MGFGGRRGWSAIVERDASANDEGIAGYSLYIMRHGIAAEVGTTGVEDDITRPLTGKGKKRMYEVASGLKRLGCELDWIVTSPLLRAAETAQIMAESLPTRVPVDSCDALSPGGSGEELKEFLAKQPERKRVLLVGHEPDLSILAGRLIGAGRHASLSFKKGGCCLIESEESPFESNGHLVWWLTPRVLRKIGDD